MTRVFYCLLFCHILFCSAQDPADAWIKTSVKQQFAPFQHLKLTQQDLLKILDTHKELFLCVIKHKQIQFFGRYDSILGDEEIKKRLQSVLGALKYLNSTMDLTNVCFLISVEDSCSKDLPVLTFAKDKTTQSICIPDFEALKGYMHIDEQIAQGRKQYPFEKKCEQAFWRGATTGGHFSLSNWKKFPRTQLVCLGLNHPQELDAKFSLLIQADPKDAFELKQKMAREKMFGKVTSIQDHLQYKYLIDVDGNSCTYSRLYWILRSNSLCIKQLSNHVQWYYSLLTPYKHYLPFSADFSDLIEQIQWAKNHPEEVQLMIQNANALSEEYLTHAQALLYLFYVIQEYKTLIDYKSFLKRF